MNEIGSEFWDAPTKAETNALFPDSVQWFLSGRSALNAILTKLKGCHTVAMPSWCCDSMIKPFINSGIEIRFYPVYWQNNIIQEVRLDCDILLLMDYFGYMGKQPDLYGFKGTIIRDITHSLFSAAYSDSDYLFGSLRKWCGVWTGGYTWAKDGSFFSAGNNEDYGYTELRRNAMRQKSDYISGIPDARGDELAKKSFLQAFDKAEDILDHIYISPAADRDIRLANLLDVDTIRTRRRNNAQVLRSAFSEWLVFPEMKEMDCPLFVPILVPNNKRRELKEYLIQQSIFCPVHWPLSEFHKLTRQELFIYENELSLVCDQRYSTEDMYRMIETINRFWKGA